MEDVFRLTYQEHVVDSQAASIIEAVEEEKFFARNLILVMDFGGEIEVHADASVPIRNHIQNLEDALEVMRESLRG